MRATAVLTLSILLPGSALLWYATSGGQAFTAEEARRLAVLQSPKALPGTFLSDQSGRTFHLADFRGRVVALEFIYTQCATICSVAGDSFAKLKNSAAAHGLGGRVQFLSISFDPARDGKEQLADYARAHGADGSAWRVAAPVWTGALPELLQACGVVVIPDGEGDFVHNAALLVADKRGRLAAIFDVGDQDAALAAIQRLDR